MIEAHNLVKWFGPNLAVDNVSLSVPQGEILGFLGPNGAGKSTTMRMITGFLPPSSGTVAIGGHDVATDSRRARQQVGYLPENAPSYPEMTAVGYLTFIAELRGYRGSSKREAVQRVVELCHLEPVRYKPIDTLSKGYRHRTCLAQSLIADPPVLVLDEPTEGLDPNQKRETRDLIRRMGQSKAIILSTHILEEVEAVCDRISIIDHGKLVADGTAAELRKRAAQAGRIRVRAHGKTGGQITELLSGLDGVAKAEVESENDRFAIVQVIPEQSAEAENAEQTAESVARTLHDSGVFFDELHTEPGSLEDVFYGVTIAETEEAKT